MIGALIGAGASIIGSLFGGGSKKQETVNRVDYKRMVRDAEAAGFNPLTALRNGGAAGFSISSTPAPPLSARIANGVASGVNTFLANFDPHQDRMREAEFGLIQAQIKNLNANSALAARVPDLGGAPARTTSGSVAKVGGPVLAGGAGIPSQPAEIVTPQVTNPWPKGWGVEVHPDAVDVGIFEETYGEIPGQVIGAPVRIWQDLTHNAKRMPGDWYIGKSAVERARKSHRRAYEYRHDNARPMSPALPW